MTRTFTIAMVATLACACVSAGESTEPRNLYNQALVALENDNWEAAERDLLDARDKAGPDPELLYRAAFNLGLAYAGDADKLATDGDKKTAIQKLYTAADWFRSAIKLRPKDEQARVNLELVLRRARVFADELNQGQNKLEARLDRLIADQRGLRDSVRQLMTRVDAENAGADPRAFRTDFDGLATSERLLVTEASSVMDFAADELGLLEDKKEEERTDQDKTRIIQLQNLTHYLQSARVGLADARRLLRRLQGDKAHSRADAGLADLKRAREQLMEPDKVLRGIAQEQAMLHAHTDALAKIRRGELTIDGGGGQKVAAKAPPWLTNTHLSERQQSLMLRTQEVLARLRAGSEQAASQDQTDPRVARYFQSAAEAVPHVEAAARHMEDADADLFVDKPGPSAEKQELALEELARAIEPFSSIRAIIELSYAQQQGIIELLTPPGDDAAKPELSTAERAKLLGTGIARNRERMQRLAGMFQDELTMLNKPPDAAANPSGQPQPTPEEIEGEKQKYQQAEVLRAQIAEELTALAAMLGKGAPRPRKGEPTALERAKKASDTIEELRKLFFSLIEHLQQLHSDQSETRDKTATANQADDAERAEKLGPLADFQEGHAQVGDQLAAAIEKQADEAQAAPTQDEQQADMAKKLAEAAPEVRAAATELRSAADAMNEARDQSASMSVDIEPILEYQKTGLEHIENALRILQPPKQDQKDQKDQDEQSDEDVSKSEAERRLQSVRDREAERRRKRRDQTPPEPVEKDW